MKQIQVLMEEGYPEMLNITYVDETHFRAGLVDGFNPKGAIFHINEAKNERYFEEVKQFLQKTTEENRLKATGATNSSNPVFFGI